MNFDRLYKWATSVVLAAAVTGHLGDLQLWVWKAQAKLLYESRTSTWGGKTHLAVALGRRLCSENIPTLFLPVNFLFEEVLANQQQQTNTPITVKMTFSQISVVPSSNAKGFHFVLTGMPE